MSTQSAATVTAETRTQLGSRANKRLRDSGKLPGVIYGHKLSVVPITLPKKEVVRYLDKGAHLFAVTVEGTAENVLVKDVQYDHLGSDVLHIDFARVDLNERVEVTVPLELKGTPKGEADGGVLQQAVMELAIECIVTGIPDAIRHNVADMALDSTLHLKDIKLPEGVKALQDPDLIIASVKEIAEEVTTEAAEATTAEPEVIGKKKEDEEAAAAAAAAEKK
jgi:large subunit ribosomal protein L25